MQKQKKKKEWVSEETVSRLEEMQEIRMIMIVVMGIFLALIATFIQSFTFLVVVGVGMVVYFFVAMIPLQLKIMRKGVEGRKI